ncbi:MAG: sigma-54 dependent transcriptional regulator [Desulfomicrobium sp.]|nr:sigma-54 dependent transcriptional regulator [Pseudomonadota bacterium]MBV1712389.1 sigma-54 dependent transcriptional regulator [Desulfomicrobium sp.]MBU4572549.1 sigma-54 dependent transcriptional regulator [Pseudomonadota bacterium]MBU4595117.1 sigma-54 dependent transcriptional regulator [Pseudomonadota bacterium]MBV1719596.1 sigma-54 dependent transcriptional regulator [Desulfomicrobium sp.]
MNTIASPRTISEVRIVIVDDEGDFARGLARLLGRRYPDAEVLAVQSGREALQLLAEKPVQLMITDLRMPEMTGMELLTQALGLQPELSMVVLTAYGTIETAVEALRAGAYDFLTKPIEPEQVFRVAAKGLERSRLLEENNRLRQILVRQEAGGELVGEGLAMRQLKQTIAAVAQSEYTVLVRGESGTGKELVARMVHHLGSRATKPFLAVNCPSIPENLLESELFGHVRGAFTGADRDHKGLFAAADKGTLHLDEIGDISPSVQTKLLRVMQDGEVRPVGSSKSSRVNVRVVASTNQDLEALIQAKTFREDLYYRLNVLTITLPPLRERVEDIPLLAGHFFRAACREMGLPEKEVDPKVLTWMAAHPWPGNVRELQNFVRRLTVFAATDRVDINLVNLVQQGGCVPVTAALVGSQGRIGEYKTAKEEVLAAFTQSYVHDLLAQTKGNVSEAARVSGLSRVALQKILSRMGESAARFRD